MQASLVCELFVNLSKVILLQLHYNYYLKNAQIKNQCIIKYPINVVTRPRLYMHYQMLSFL